MDTTPLPDPGTRFPDAFLLDSLTAHTATLDGDGDILFVNRAWREFAIQNGWPSGTALGGNYLAACASALGAGSEGAAEVAAGLRAVLRGDREEFRREYPCRAVTGELWFVMRAARFAGPGPTRAIVTHDDITERKQAEQASRESEARYQQIVANAPGMVYQFVLHPDGSFDFPFVSDGCREICGVEPDEARRDPAGLLALIHPEDRPGFDRSIAESAVSLRPWKWEGRITTPTGEPKWIQAASRPERLGGGEVLWAGLLMDITQRKRAEHVSLGQTAVLTRTLGALAGAPDLDAFQGLVLQAIAEQLQSQRTSLWFHDPQQQTLVLSMTCADGRPQCAAESDHPAAAQPFPAAELPLWQEIVRLRRPVIVQDVATDPRVVRHVWLRDQGVRTLLLVPLFQGEEVIGKMSISSTTRRVYRPEEIELAQTLAHQVALAVQLTGLAEQKQQTAVLHERNRMAREIHDTLAQGFAGILVQMDAAEDALTGAPAEAASALGHLARARGLARESLTEARRSVLALRPHALEHQELPEALQQMARRLTAGTGLSSTVVVHGTPRPLPSPVEDDLLRIAQEALTNVIKHAGAGQALIDLTFEARHVRLRVEDDGAGFDPQEPRPPHGFGLTGMRERAERIGGHLAVTSAPGRGTTAVAVVPAGSTPHATPRSGKQGR